MINAGQASKWGENKSITVIIILHVLTIYLLHLLAFLLKDFNPFQYKTRHG